MASLYDIYDTLNYDELCEKKQQLYAHISYIEKLCANIEYKEYIDHFTVYGFCVIINNIDRYRRDYTGSRNLKRVLRKINDIHIINHNIPIRITRIIKTVNSEEDEDISIKIHYASDLVEQNINLNYLMSGSKFDIADADKQFIQSKLYELNLTWTSQILGPDIIEKTSIIQCSIECILRYIEPKYKKTNTNLLLKSTPDHVLNYNTLVFITEPFTIYSWDTLPLNIKNQFNILFTHKWIELAVNWFINIDQNIIIVFVLPDLGG